MTKFQIKINFLKWISKIFEIQFKKKKVYSPCEYEKFDIKFLKLFNINGDPNSLQHDFANQFLNILNSKKKKKSRIL